MAAPVEQAGEVVACPVCGEKVLLKSTIPILGSDGKGIAYACKDCARLMYPDEAELAAATADSAEPADAG